MRKRLLSLLLLSICGSMLFAQEPLDIDDVEQVPLGDFTYQLGIYVTVLHYMESAGLY